MLGTTVRLAALALALPLALTACSGGDGVEGSPSGGISPSADPGAGPGADDNGGG